MRIDEHSNTYQSPKFIVLLVIFWFTTVSTLQVIIGRNYIYILRFIPFALVFFLMIFTYKARYHSKYPRYSLLNISDPVIIFIFYLCWAALISLTTVKTIGLFYMAYGYLITYFLTIINGALIYSFLANRNLIATAIEKSDERKENPVCRGAYWSCAISIVIIIFKVGFHGLGAEQEADLADLGLLVLPILAYPLAFGWTITRILMLPLSLIILFAGGSRTAILSTFIMCLALLFVKLRLRYFIIISFITITFLSLPPVFMYLNDRVLFLSDPVKGIHSLTGRFETWQILWKAFLQNPVMGMGFRVSDYWLQASEKVHGHMVSTHNAYLASLLETGIIGTTLMLLTIVLTLWWLFKMARNYQDKTSLFYFGILLGSCAFGFTERFIFNVGNPTSLLCIFALFHSRIALNYRRGQSP